MKILALLCVLPTIIHADEISGIPRVIDGDTVVIGSSHIRLSGIDAPELKQICTDGNFQYLCGLRSKYALKTKINEKLITCIYNSKDMYGRELGVCYLNQEDLNKWMVSNGYAVHYYGEQYLIDEIWARSNKLGIWKGEFQLPSEYRKHEKK